MHVPPFRLLGPIPSHGSPGPAPVAKFLVQGVGRIARAGVVARDLPARLRKTAHQQLAQAVRAAGNQNMVCHGVSLKASWVWGAARGRGAPHNRRHRNSPARLMEPSNPLEVAIRNHLAARGGWMGFDDFMQQALSPPGLGYYANTLPKFGDSARADGEQAGGSDFVTAPELTPLFGYALARQVAQALQATGCAEIWEFGAGSGALAGQLLDALDALGVAVPRSHGLELPQTPAQRPAEGRPRGVRARFSRWRAARVWESSTTV